MIVAAAPELVVDIGIFAGAIAAVIAAAAAVGRLKPVRWVARVLIGDPIARWFRREVHDEVRPIVQEETARVLAEHMEAEEETVREIHATARSTLAKLDDLTETVVQHVAEDREAFGQLRTAGVIPASELD